MHFRIQVEILNYRNKVIGNLVWHFSALGIYMGSGCAFNIPEDVPAQRVFVNTARFLGYRFSKENNLSKAIGAYLKRTMVTRWPLNSYNTNNFAHTCSFTSWLFKAYVCLQLELWHLPYKIADIARTPGMVVLFKSTLLNLYSDEEAVWVRVENFYINLW